MSVLTTTHVDLLLSASSWFDPDAPDDERTGAGELLTFEFFFLQTLPGGSVAGSEDVSSAVTLLARSERTSVKTAQIPRGDPRQDGRRTIGVQVFDALDASTSASVSVRINSSESLVSQSSLATKIERVWYFGHVMLYVCVCLCAYVRMRYERMCREGAGRRINYAILYHTIRPTLPFSLQCYMISDLIYYRSASLPLHCTAVLTLTLTLTLTLYLHFDNTNI